MKANVRLTIALIALLTVTRAQEFPPELVQLKTAYVQAVTTIRANAEARGKPLVTSYLAALTRVEKQFASDPVLSVIVVPEMERNLTGGATKALNKVEWKRVSSFLTKPTLKFKHANKR